MSDLTAVESLPRTKAEPRFSLARFLSSPLLSLGLLLCLTAVGVRWSQVEAVRHAPDVPGYNWGQHPHTLLLAYPSKDCGCGESPTERVRAALKDGQDVLVMSPAPSPPLLALQRANFPASRVFVVTNARAEDVQRFSRDNLATVSVVNGRITKVS